MVQVYDSANKTAAKIVGNSAAMDAAAEKVADLARENARKHNGVTWGDPEALNFADAIKVITTSGGLDRLIVNTDPLAIPKEFGHILVSHGEQVGRVKGQFSMTNAARGIRSV